MRLLVMLFFAGAILLMAYLMVSCGYFLCEVVMLEDGADGPVSAFVSVPFTDLSFPASWIGVKVGIAVVMSGLAAGTVLLVHGLYRYCERRGSPL